MNNEGFQSKQQQRKKDDDKKKQMKMIVEYINNHSLLSRVFPSKFDFLRKAINETIYYKKLMNTTKSVSKMIQTNCPPAILNHLAETNIADLSQFIKQQKKLDYYKTAKIKKLGREAEKEVNRKIKKEKYDWCAKSLFEEPKTDGCL